MIPSLPTSTIAGTAACCRKLSLTGVWQRVPLSCAGGTRQRFGCEEAIAKEVGVNEISCGPDTRSADCGSPDHKKQTSKK